MIAAEREHAEAAQQVEIAGIRAVEKILTPAGFETDVEADGLEHPDHLLIQMLRVQRVSLRFPLGEQRSDIVIHTHFVSRPITEYLIGETELDRPACNRNGGQGV